MKIAISAIDGSIEAPIDTRFGRCAYFLIVDTETMKSEVFFNKSASTSGGAGIQAAQTVINMGAEAVITGNVGPNAYQTLKAAGIRVITGASGSVKEAIERFKKGELKETPTPTVGAHSGMGGRGN